MDVKLKKTNYNVHCIPVSNLGAEALLRIWAVEISASFCSHSCTTSLIVATQFISLRAQRRRWLQYRPMKIIQILWWVWHWEVITGSISYHCQTCESFFFFFISTFDSCPPQVPHFNRKKMNNQSETVFGLFVYEHKWKWIELHPGRICRICEGHYMGILLLFL